MVALQRVVDRSGAKHIILTSGSRCLAYQMDLVRKGISSSPNSYHLLKEDYGLYTLAADCIFRGVTLAAALRAAEVEPDFALGGIGLYVGKHPRLHLDVRRGRARWAFVDGIATPFEQARAVMLGKGI